MSAINILENFVDKYQRIFVLTGAGCSTNSGIPDYRDADGNWKRTQPMTFQAFMGSDATRRRYWARSLLGWRRFGSAQPNDAHRALAKLQQIGKCEVLLTQNVDGLHDAAGHTGVIDLHGRLDLVRCMGCERRIPRDEFQHEMGHRNPGWLLLDAKAAPDGDADLESDFFDTFDVPPCAYCGGILKPDVVFFGETVPRERVEAAHAHLAQADAMLIVGSSLMVYSGYRFAQAASRAALPIAAINQGRTRADDALAFKVEENCEDALAFLL